MRYQSLLDKVERLARKIDRKELLLFMSEQDYEQLQSSPDKELLDRYTLSRWPLDCAVKIYIGIDSNRM